MNPTIPWSIAGNVTIEVLSERLLIIAGRLVKSKTLDKIKELPVSTINSICIQILNTIAPKGFVFGFDSGQWCYHRSSLWLPPTIALSSL